MNVFALDEEEIEIILSGGSIELDNGLSVISTTELRRLCLLAGEEWED